MLAAIAVSAFFIAADVAPPPPPPSIAVLDLKPARPEDAALAKLASSALVQSLAAHAKGSRVIGEAEIKATLDVAAQQRLLGCDDDRCSADFAKAASTDQIVVGRIGVVGGRALAFASLV